MKINRLRSRRKRQAGFLLMDALIASFVGTLVLVSFLGLTMSSMVATSVAQQNVIACNCAREILENIRLRYGATVTTGTYSDATVFGSVPELSSLNQGSASVLVTTVGNLKEVVITVSWKISAGTKSTKSRTFASLIGARGVAQ